MFLKDGRPAALEYGGRQRGRGLFGDRLNSRDFQSKLTRLRENVVLLTKLPLAKR